MLSKIFPIFSWLPSYQKESLRFDIIAGLTTAAVVIPKAMAYGAIAGLPLVVGLYTALVPLLVYIVMGTSRPLSVSTTTTLAILTAGALSQVAPGGDAATLMAASTTLALLTGGFLLLGGVLRLGVVADLISDPVLTGFKAGIGLIIILDQIPKLLGIHISKAGFFRDIASIGGHLADTSLTTLLFALAMLVFMLGLERFVPKAPAPLITVALGIAVAAFAGLDKMGIALVGTVQAGLPSFALPDFSLLLQLWPAALGIALMSFVETAAAGRAFVRKGEQTPDANRELVATGIANLVGSLFHIMPSGGGTSQTAVNYNVGARSQLAGVVSAAVVVATLLFLAPLFGLMPHPTLAAVVVLTSIGLINVAEFRTILTVRSMEFRWALVAMTGVLLLGTLQGILVAVLVSLVGLMVSVNLRPLIPLGRKPGTNVFRPRSEEHPEDETFPGLLILRPEGGIFFANAKRLGQKIRAQLDEHTPRVLILDLGAVPDMEITALRMLTDGEEKIREHGTTLWLTALNPEVLKVIQHSPLWERLGRERMFFTLEQAVEKYLEKQNSGVRIQETE
jgi:high affinity sulfate transporter 1